MLPILNRLAIFYALYLFSNFAIAATLDITVNGRLAGAFDVDVNGTTYDVRFQKGSCFSLFNGCDDTFDFVFQDETSAGQATDALGDQLFFNDPTNQFDRLPGLTVGCLDPRRCRIWTPFIIGPNNNIAAYLFVNENNDLIDASGISATSAFSDFTTDDIGSVYAVWSRVSPVPVPAGAWLFGTALIGLVGYRKRRKPI